MKKFFITAIIAIFSYAGVNNYAVSLTDIKDALYHLILDYKALKQQVKKSDISNNQNLLNTKKEIEKQITELKKLLNENNTNDKRNNEKLKELVMSKYQELKNQIVSLNKVLNISIKGSSNKDKYDKYIESYVKKNTKVLQAK